MSNTTRAHTHEIELDAAPEDVFAILHTPSAIRQWWGASRAIVLLPEDSDSTGVWAATWGDDEDHPQYVTTAVIREFDPPRRLVFTDYIYQSADGPMPFDADFVTTFTVEHNGDGSILRVEQAGFPVEGASKESDEFYKGCEIGWRDTFANIEKFVEQTG